MMKSFFAILSFVVSLHAHTQETRIENEYKLSLPCDKSESVWHYLKQTYPNKKELADRNLTASFSVEIFKDTYFDTPDLKMLKMLGGIRRRHRLFVDQTDHPKHNRSLVQIKLSRPLDRSTNRSEIKFKTDKKFKHLPKWTRLDKIVEDKNAFRSELKKLGIDVNNLGYALELSQERRRVYLHQGESSYATLTLDLVDSTRWFHSIGFCEIELELNEIRYTQALPQKRAEMQKGLDLIKNDLTRDLPFLIQDQTPKYNKTLEAFSKKHSYFKTLIEFLIRLNTFMN